MSDPLANPGPLIKRVYAYVAYRVGSGPDAEDITSAAFERALRYRESFDSRRGDPATWLIGIARRCIADANLSRDIPAADLPEDEIEGHDDLANIRLDLAAAVAALDGRERELIALRYGGDLTARQIGDLLGMKSNAVEVALHRAIARLRSALADDAPDRNAAAMSVHHTSTDPSAP